MNETFLTVKQAAARLQVETHTVRHWLRLGRVHGVKIGRDWRISDRELTARVSGQPTRIPVKPNPLAAALAVMDALQVEIVYDPATRFRAREMARKTNQIRIYDSTYAALAEARGAELWTADERFFNSVGSTLQFVKFIGNYGD